MPRLVRPAVAILAALAALLLAAPLAGASIPTYKGASADGEVVFFETDERLASGDTDTRRDVYQRAFDPTAGEAGAYVTRQVSTGPTGGNDAYNALFEKVSGDGSRVFFSTDEPLAADDTDHRGDVYLREPATGTTTLVSQGEAGCAPACGSAAFDARFAAASADGGEVFFVTDEKLAAADTDSEFDIYLRELGAEPITSLVSAGESPCSPACGNGAFGVVLWGISADGSRAFFTTPEALSEFDLDSSGDIYSRNLAGADTTTLVSRGGEGCAPTCGNSGAVPVFQDSSVDGARVFFTTSEQLVGGDEDSVTDAYARDLPGGLTILISGGQPSTDTASFAAASGDGNHVFFTTAESLVLEDEDSVSDIYEWSGGSFDLVTSAECVSACGVTFNAISESAEEVVFSTADSLVAADLDASVDIYRQHVGAGAPVLVSRGGAGCVGCGDGPVDARFNRASSDGSHVVFASVESLTTDDGDGEDDIYARDVDGGDTSLITTSPSYCPLKKGNCGATFVDASVDGLHVFFTTVERFTLDDGDNEVDAYERFLGATPGDEVTRLVSTGNSPDLELGPAIPSLEETDPESPGTSTSPRILGESEPNTAIKLYTQAGCSGEVKAIGTAAELAGGGIEVNVAVSSTTTFRATATDVNGDTSACSESLAYVHSNGSGGGGEGGSTGGVKAPVKVSVGPSVPLEPLFLTPRTRITFAPASKTRQRNPTFRFVDSTGQEGTRFRCKIDRRGWRSCGSPVKVKKLGRGRHVFAVKGVNVLGEWEAKPAKRAFKVVPG